MQGLVLTHGFGKAAARLADASRYSNLTGEIKEVLPVYEEAVWNQDRVVNSGNCYSFALNDPNPPPPLSLGDYTYFLAPGQIAHIREVGDDQISALKFLRGLTQKISFTAFARKIIDGAVRDGLTPLGEQFRVQAGGYPMALFLHKDGWRSKDHEFHWYGMRRDADGNAIWAYKYPYKKTQVVTTDIFRHAEETGWGHFAGYFLRPGDLQLQ